MLLRLHGFLCFAFLRFLSNMLYWNRSHKYERKSQNERVFHTIRCRGLQHLPPFCCEGAPAFRCGEESQLSFFHITRNVVLLEI